MAKFMFNSDVDDIYKQHPVYLQHTDDEIIQLVDLAVEGFLLADWGKQSEGNDFIITLAESKTHCHFLSREGDTGTYRLERIESEGA